jgi:hypothetical protein
LQYARAMTVNNSTVHPTPAAGPAKTGTLNGGGSWEQLSMFEPPVRTCRRCGCTEERACVGGCWWVQDDLCSACYLYVAASKL